MPGFEASGFGGVGVPAGTPIGIIETLNQEINAAPSEPLECVLVRSDQEAVVVNLDIPAVESPEEVYWVDPIHQAPKDKISDGG